MNRLMGVYATGSVQPRYPAIDSPLYSATMPAFPRLLQLAAQVATEESTAGEAFFAPTLRFSLLLLELQLRDEAARYEPLEQGENQAAFQRASGPLAWDRYPYSAIVIPGAGADRDGVALSPFGRLRLHVAALRYRNGQAPYIIVSGGHVHPNRTPYCEAIEMKKALVKDFGIPADAVIVDPHARHTTTNLRNAARLIYRYGLPFDKPALITTDPGQSRYIEDPGFATRCRTELRYLPFRELKRTSAYDLQFLPSADSLTQDPTDPLDP